MLAGRDFASSVRFTAKITSYRNGRVDIISCERPVFRPAGYESAFGSADERRRSERCGKRQQNSDGTVDEARSIRRAKARVRQIALANDFDYFVTLTQDKEKVDRYDIKESIRKLTKWCENQVQRHGLRYVVIPERHKDGAIHYHGFMSWDGDAGSGMIESGTYTMDGWNKPRKARSEKQALSWMENGARVVYNLARWKFGFSTALEVYGDYGAAVGYVCKYIGKQMGNSKIGGRWYYSGGRLRKATVSYFNLRPDELAGLPGTFVVDSNVTGRMRLWRGNAEDFVKLIGPRLDEAAFAEFCERFYPEDEGDAESLGGVEDCIPAWEILDNISSTPFD